MDDERITSVSDDGSTHTTVTRSSGGGWMIGLIAILLLGVAIYFFAIQSDSTADRNRAVSEAAKDVGDAARNVGDAAKDAADELKKQ
ncbi:hypothetical protein [Novosphingobium sp. TH158]|uniref:hypothetical protein n=1 Tax=Novosphingobium sp. TH158 TaxID=2067455 RepID=UPI000C7E1880|nr:hypothetical protein [Novosphingobium sp. TH158]PLK26241.1 hypothetical protein C0V78_04585 [Novosphingobium sp. TH158]